MDGSQTVHMLHQTLSGAWIDDSASESCLLCKRKFNMLVRRHHCRSCGSLVCGNCSKRKIPLDFNISSKPERVCDLCYDKVKSARDAGQVTPTLTSPNPRSPLQHIAHFMHLDGAGSHKSSGGNKTLTHEERVKMGFAHGGTLDSTGSTGSHSGRLPGLPPRNEHLVGTGGGFSNATTATVGADKAQQTAPRMVKVWEVREDVRSRMINYHHSFYIRSLIQFFVDKAKVTIANGVPKMVALLVDRFINTVSYDLGINLNKRRSLKGGEHDDQSLKDITEEDFPALIGLINRDLVSNMRKSLQYGKIGDELLLSFTTFAAACLGLDSSGGYKESYIRETIRVHQGVEQGTNLLPYSALHEFVKPIVQSLSTPALTCLEHCFSVVASMASNAVKDVFPHNAQFGQVILSELHTLVNEAQVNTLNLLTDFVDSEAAYLYPTTQPQLTNRPFPKPADGCAMCFNRGVCPSCTGCICAGCAAVRLVRSTTKTIGGPKPPPPAGAAGAPTTGAIGGGTSEDSKANPSVRPPPPSAAGDKTSPTTTTDGSWDPSQHGPAAAGRGRRGGLLKAEFDFQYTDGDEWRPIDEETIVPSEAQLVWIEEHNKKRRPYQAGPPVTPGGAAGGGSASPTPAASSASGSAPPASPTLSPSSPGGAAGSGPAGSAAGAAAAEPAVEEEKQSGPRNYAEYLAMHSKGGGGTVVVVQAGKTGFVGANGKRGNVLSLRGSPPFLSWSEGFIMRKYPVEEPKRDEPSWVWVYSFHETHEANITFDILLNDKHRSIGGSITIPARQTSVVKVRGFLQNNTMVIVPPPEPAEPGPTPVAGGAAPPPLPKK